MQFMALVALAAVLLAGCASADSHALPKAEAVDVVCPYGHHTVRRIPVLHGLMAIDAALQRKIDRHEVVYGGCVNWGNNYALVCATCGFAFDEVVMPHRWIREAQDPASFRPTLAPTLVAFRAVAGKALRYRQQVYDNGAMDEGIAFLLPETDDRARTFIEQWLADLGAKPKTTQLGTTTMWDAGAWKAVLTLHVSNGAPTTFVTVDHRLKPPTAVSAVQR